MEKRLMNILMLLRKSIKNITLVAITLFSVLIYLNAYAENETNSIKYSEFDFDTFYEQNKDYWGNSCEEDDKDCQEDILKSQKKFYTKLYKLLAKYEKRKVITPETTPFEYAAIDDILIETAFFEMTPQTFTDDGENYKNEYSDDDNGKSAYNIDESDLDDPDETDDFSSEDAVNATLEYYEKETDTVKLLVKNMFSYSTDCYGVYGDPTANTASDGSSYYTCSSGTLETLPKRGDKCVDKIQSQNLLPFYKYYISKINHDETLSFFEKAATFVQAKFYGSFITDEYYEACKAFDSNYAENTMYVYNDGEIVSFEKFFDFLYENKYFDNKPHLQYRFKDILDEANVNCMTNMVCSNSLESSSDGYDKYQDEIKDVRLEIINDILSILENNSIEIEYDPLNSEYKSAEQSATRKSFYWPIGSSNIEQRNGVLYADGDPASTEILYGFGQYENPVTNEVSKHYGIDIIGEDGITNVIAAYQGEIISVVSNCSSDTSCNEGYGNTIIIAHSNGDYTVYAHLASIDSSISVGASVNKGQLIGKVGTTGETVDAVLHFEIRKGGNDVINAINPTSVITSDNPRPTGPSGDEISTTETSLTKEEYKSLLTSYCASSSCKPYYVNIFVTNADEIYDLSIKYGVNPELVAIRAIIEKTTQNNNYWGLGCKNGRESTTCLKYSSLEEGIKGFASVVTKYSTFFEMQSHYTYLGDHWYNPGGSGVGGCYYFSSIKKYMESSRISEVENYCNPSLSCIKDHESQGMCYATSQDDRTAYTYYQIETTSNFRYNMFGL